MYKKKNRTPMILTIVIVVIAILFILAVPYIKGFRDRQNIPEMEIETETEIPVYEAMIHKTDAGKIEIDGSLLKADNDTETRLSIKAGTLVTLTVTPRTSKVLDSVQIVDAKDFSHTTQSIISDASDHSYNVDFSMPENDIIINFKFLDKETEPLVLPTTEVALPESETEEKKPYDLTLHGITADLIMEYDGNFDDRAFLQQLGDALHMDSARSTYYRVTDVTFSSEKYTGEKDSDKVYKYIYFNEDPSWKVLSTYFMRDDAYVFTEPAEETEVVTETAANTAAGSNGYGTGSTSYDGSGTSGYSGGVSGGNSSGGQTVTTTTTTTFDIMEVSTTFLSYVGDQDKFYDKTFKYVLSKGLTGHIIGTMSNYEIDPGNRNVTFWISLNTGGSITGTYDKANNKYNFSGL